MHASSPDPIVVAPHTPISLTASAARRITALQSSSGAQAIRIAMKKGGCAGMEYALDPLAERPKAGMVLERDGAVLAIDPMAEMFLFGTEIDYNEGVLESGFVFRNPNVKSACGCGASVGF